jgi:hypothetical protein
MPGGSSDDALRRRPRQWRDDGRSTTDCAYVGAPTCAAFGAYRTGSVETAGIDCAGAGNFRHVPSGWH